MFQKYDVIFLLNVQTYEIYHLKSSALEVTADVPGGFRPVSEQKFSA